MRVWLLAIVAASTACGDNVRASDKDLTAFALLQANNPALTADATATIAGTVVDVRTCSTMDASALAATFSTTGASVRIGDTPQISGETVNDFTHPVTYTVVAEDGSTKDYTVAVAGVAFASGVGQLKPPSIFLLGPLLVADFNLDGKPDLVTVGTFEGDAVTTLLDTTRSGDSSPTFELTGPGTLESIDSIAVGDIDGDGHADLVVTSCCEPVSPGIATAAVQIFASAPTTSPGVTIPTSFEAPEIGIGDLDGDGRLDLALAGEGVFSVFVNTTVAGVPSFSPEIDMPMLHDFKLMTIGDINGDGRADLVLLDSRGVLSVAVDTTPPSATTPTFAAGIEVATSGVARGVAIQDIDGDGRPDLLVGALPSSLEIFVNTTAPGATTASFTAIPFDTVPEALGVVQPCGPSCWSVDDFDGDGKLDIAVMTTSGFAVLRNTTAAAAPTPSWDAWCPFDLAAELPQYNESKGLVAADFNADGKPDLALRSFAGQSVGADNIWILLAR